MKSALKACSALQKANELKRKTNKKLMTVRQKNFLPLSANVRRWLAAKRSTRLAVSGR